MRLPTCYKPTAVDRTRSEFPVTGRQLAHDLDTLREFNNPLDDLLLDLEPYPFDLEDPNTLWGIWYESSEKPVPGYGPYGTIDEAFQAIHTHFASAVRIATPETPRIRTIL